MRFVLAIAREKRERWMAEQIEYVKGTALFSQPPSETVARVQLDSEQQSENPHLMNGGALA
jgi:hypothetical protein